MEMHGFDLNPRLIDRIQEVVDEHLPEGDLHLYNEDGIRMQPLEAEEESFDCVISDPPYLNCPDLYTDDPEDLSNMKQEEWEDLMRESFRQYHRLLKRSQVKDKTFYPLMLRMTADPTEEAWKRAMQEAVHHQDQEEHQPSTIHPVIMKMNASRRAETGMVSMDFILARIAAEEGFTLWDRTFNTLAPAAVAVSALRNYDFHYTHKNWETTLVWIKQ
jgi:methylase of polypeptide subunit release factors